MYGGFKVTRALVWNAYPKKNFLDNYFVWFGLILTSGKSSTFSCGSFHCL